jgi:L-seryl-tRNA(Ser) seleniumtransferase
MKPGSEVKADPRRDLPSVERLQRSLREREPRIPEWAAVEASRREIDLERERVLKDARGPAAVDTLIERALRRAERLAAPHPRRVVNATGIVLHTNLGRAPLAPGAADAVAAAAAGYSDLELDLETGRRGDRIGAVADKIVRLSGAEAAFAVNNNAAAVVLILNTLALGREAVVSRGELVEIGGSFRVPEIMERSGVVLREVGATNRTHPADYERAIGDATALLLKVHRSNFEQRGFVSEVGLDALVDLGRRSGLPVVEDLGSGTLVEIPGLPAEAWAPGRLRLGADLVCFSGDKLLGGPQAGIILGRADLVEAVRANPLARALRLDKLGLAALDWTLDACLEGRAERDVPVFALLTTPPERLEQRARRLAERLEKAAAGRAVLQCVADTAFVGGGSLPGLELPGFAVAVRAEGGPQRLADRLRAAPVPVLARVRDDVLLLDVRTLLDGDEPAVEAAFEHALDESG